MVNRPTSIKIDRVIQAVLQSAGVSGEGNVVVSQLGAEAAAAAAGTRPEGGVIVLHSDLAALRSAIEELDRRNLAERVLFFHGRIQDLQREIPLCPRMLAARTGDDLLAFWNDIPAGALLIVEESFPAEERWQADGYLERFPESPGPGVFVASRRFKGLPASLPPPIFRRLRAGLLRRYATAAPEPAKLYTPVSELTREAREWRMAQTKHARGGYEDWPYRRPASLPLPDTLPNGDRWPLISIVTPSFNQGRYLEETILSVQEQQYPRVEHVVIDGGSTDESPGVLARYRESLNAVVSEKDGGQSHAINKGMALARGDILTWLNSDDMLAPGALAAVAMGFQSSRADLVAGIVHLRSGRRTTATHLTCCEPGPLPLDRILDLHAGWNAGQFFYQPEVMFSRGAWERAGSHVREDLVYSMDFDLWVRMAETGARLHVIGRPVALFRVHDAQKTSDSRKFRAELKGYVKAYNRKMARSASPAAAPLPERKKLRILMLNDHGYHFGAGIAHRRTAQSLALAGHDVRALAFRPTPGHRGILTDLTGVDILQAVRKIDPDLILAGNIHSASQEAWHIGILAQSYPTLSVLHDFWMLTGRCAYPKPCEKFLAGCDETCPTADEYPKLAPFLIAGAWEQKQNLLFGRNHLALLANSAWMREQTLHTLAARGSGRPHAPVAAFRLSFPVDRFRPRDRGTCRSRLALPEERFIVLLAGPLADGRKKARVALEAVENLRLENVTVVSLGVVVEEEVFALDVRRPGQIDDEDLLAAYYAAADIVVVPSDEETFGQVFLEAAACGTPSVGVRGSGVEEAVVDGVTGILVEEASVEALAAAIFYLYRDPERRAAMGAWGRIHAENEWSPEAAYYYMFQAWRELGLLDRWRLRPQISFRVDPSGPPEVKLLERRERVTVGDCTMGPEEGPFPEFDLPVFRWAFGPVSRIKVHVHEAGRYSVVLKYRNTHNDQHLTLSIQSTLIDNFALAATGMSRSRVVCVAVELPEGESEIELGFTRWQDPAIDGRPLAIAITEFAVLPEVREEVL